MVMIPAIIIDGETTQSMLLIPLIRWQIKIDPAAFYMNNSRMIMSWRHPCSLP